MYYKANPNNYTRCEKCKHIDRENEECKITNDKWLVPDRAGTCHQYEGVKMNNPIKPNHYKAGSFDVIAFCFEHDLDFATGNIIKYVTRAGKKDKDKTLEDLFKAKEYLERKIERVIDND